MAQGSRPERIGEEIRQELSQALGTEVRDPGIGFVTLTRVKVSPDLQVARVYYTIIGDEKAKRETKKALERATPFLRRHVAATVRLRRVPELHFHFDESVEKQDRIEQILIELQKEREARDAAETRDLKVPGSGDAESEATDPGSNDTDPGSDDTDPGSDDTRSPGPSGPGKARS